MECNTLTPLRRQHRPVLDNAAVLALSPIERYTYALPIVKELNQNRTLAGNSWIDDLESAGRIRLWESCNLFDSSIATEFLRYCRRRVKNAMNDEWRLITPVSRWIRNKTKRMAVATEALLHELRREPTVSEILLRAFPDPDERRRVKENGWALTTGTVSLDKVELMLRDDNETPYQYLAQKDDYANLFKWVRELPNTKRQVLEMYYFDRKKQREIGVLLGLTGSRVNQLLTETRKRLRELYLAESVGCCKIDS